MANIQRYGGLMDDVFGDLMKGFWVKPVALSGEPELNMKVELEEDERAYTLHAEIPGVKKDDIQVEVDGNRVSIRAEVKQDKEKKNGGKLLHSERYYGMVARSMVLPTDVDEQSVKAQYKDGMLDLMLPKKANVAARRVTIS